MSRKGWRSASRRSSSQSAKAIASIARAPLDTTGRRRSSVVGAEYIAGLLPRGTHAYGSFIKPSELGAWLREAGLQLEDVSGLAYDPVRRTAWVNERTDVNYLACAVKE